MLGDGSRLAAFRSGLVVGGGVLVRRGAVVTGEWILFTIVSKRSRWRTEVSWSGLAAPLGEDGDCCCGGGLAT